MSMRQQALLLLDLLAALTATILAILVRENLDVDPIAIGEYLPYIGSTAAVSIVALPAFGVNRRLWRFTTIGDCAQICSVSMLIAIGAVALTFSFNRLAGVPRSLPILQFVFVAFALTGERVARRVWTQVAERQGVDATELRGPAPEMILVVGLGRLAELYIRAVTQLAPGSARIAGILAPTDRHTGHFVRGCLVLGAITNIRDVVQKLEVHGVSVDRIAVAAEFDELTQEQQAALAAFERETATPISFLPEQLQLNRRPERRDFVEAKQAFSISADDISVLSTRRYWKFRRSLDVVGAAALILLLAPFAAIVAILTVIDLGRPVVFWQQRPGYLGRPFRLYKFRTMAPAHDEAGQRVADEDRSSGLGIFLRRTRLDEYPQLLNILVGEMSFIGPRPLLPVDQPPEFSARQLVRPGLTGWAQVVGGRAISASDKAALDVWYVLNASPALDLEIVIRTLAVLILGERINDKLVRRAWTELDQRGVCDFPKAAE